MSSVRASRPADKTSNLRLEAATVTVLGTTVELEHQKRIQVWSQLH